MPKFWKVATTACRTREADRVVGGRPRGSTEAKSDVGVQRAASMNARLGNLARAAELLQVATQSPDLADQVEKLREQLVQVPRHQ